MKKLDLTRVVHEGTTFYADEKTGAVYFGGDMTPVHEAAGVTTAEADRLTREIMRKVRK